MGLELSSRNDRQIYKAVARHVEAERGNSVVFNTNLPIDSQAVVKWWHEHEQPWILQLADKDEGSALRLPDKTVRTAHLFIDVAYGHLILVTRVAYETQGEDDVRLNVTIGKDFVEADGYCAFAETLSGTGSHERLYRVP